MINLFAHRGFWKNEDSQNSISSLESAYENKFDGVEFDVWFYDENLVINHDEPQHYQNLLNLSNYLKFGNEIRYWIDFKNLNLGNAKKAFTVVKKAVNNFNIDLSNIYLAPFVTNYKISRILFQIAKEVFGPKVQFAAVLEYQEEIDDLLEFVIEEEIPYLSASYELINSELIQKIPNVEIFVWTINDLNKITELESLGVKNFITDLITPQIYENISRLSWSQG